MRILIHTSLFLFTPVLLNAQENNPTTLKHISFERVTDTVYHPTDTLFYPFHDGVQMIEIDYATSWYLNAFKNRPTRLGSFSSHDIIPLPCPFPNIYLFRNQQGEIVKAYNTSLSLKELSLQFRRIPLQPNTPTLVQCKKHMKGPFNTPLPVYFISHTFYTGYYKVYAINHLNKTINSPVGLIDSTGKIILPMVYNAIEPLNENLLVNKNNKWSIINKQQKNVLPATYDMYTMPYENTYCFWNENKIYAIYQISGNPLTVEPGKKTFDVFRINAYDEFPHMEDFSSATITTYIKDGKIGLINNRFKALTEAIFDVCDYNPRQGSLSRALKNNKWGYIDSSGKTTIPFEYDYAGYFGDDATAVVQQNGGFKCITQKGEVISLPCNDYHSWNIDQDYFHVQVVQEGNYYGIVNPEEKILVPIAYQYIRKEEHEPFYRIKKNNSYGIMDTLFNVVLECQYDEMSNFYLEHFLVIKNKKHGLVNQEFKEVIPCRYDYLNFDASNNLVFSINGKYGVMDMKGKIIVKPAYDMIRGFNGEGYSAVMRDSVYGFINTAGVEVIPVIHKNLGTEIRNERVWFLEKGKFGFLNANGKIAIPAIYDEVREFDRYTTPVKKGYYWALIDTTGKEITPYEYDEINNGWNALHHCKVKKAGRFGIINMHGEIIIPCLYDEILIYANEKGILYYRVEQENNWLELDLMGNKIKE